MLLLAACNDDKDMFDVPVPAETISFQPVSGGAVMRYALPDDTGICAVKVCYRNERDEEVTILGTPYADSVVLTGFDAPRRDVPVRISVTDNNNVESEPIERTFNTLASCPYAFIDSVKVEESWNGLNIVSSYTGKITGIVDVYRVGINPFSKKLDTLYIRNFTIAAGTVKNFVSIATEDEESTIVLKTGDGKGNHVRTLVVPGVKNHSTQQYPRQKLSVTDPGEMSYEYKGVADDSPYRASYFGIEYLTDGDLKGKIRKERGKNAHYYTYVTKVNGNGSYVQVELEEPQVIASVRLYGVLRDLDAIMSAGDLFAGNYIDRLPCKVRVDASDDGERWETIASFEQQKDGYGDCWGRTTSLGWDVTVETYDKTDPYYAEIVAAISDLKYKYLRVYSLDHFTTWTFSGDNTGDRISYHELEVYVQKD